MDPPRALTRFRGIARTIVLAIALAGVINVLVSPPLAAGAITTNRDHVTVTFQLHVTGHMPPGMTFWVAYGPLAGRFGIVELHRTPVGDYRAMRRLPAQGRTTFTYLASFGMITTPAGPAPGGPTIIIRSIRPVTALEVARIRVYWRAPQG
jgi:hypothetical protein